MPDQPITRTTAFVLRSLWQHRWLHLVLLVAVAVAVAASVGARFSLKYLVDAIAAGPDHMPEVWRALVIFIGFVCADNLLWRVGGFAAAHAFPAVGAAVRLDLFRHLLGHSTSYFARHFTGALANRVTAAANATYTIESTLAWNLLPPALAIVVSLATLVWVDLGMALVLAIAVVLIGAFMAAGSLRGRPIHAAYAERAAAVGGEIVDVVGNHGTVRAFAAAPREYTRLRRRIGVEAKAHRRALLYMERLRVAHALAISVLSTGMLVWAVLLWQRQAITAGDVVVIGTFSIALLQASRDLAVALVEAAHHWSRLHDAITTVVVPHDLPDRAAPAGGGGGRGRGEIVLDRVSFRYPGVPFRPAAAAAAAAVIDPAVLDSVSCHVPAGQKLGIVGPSGAGKTTLLALIQHLYPPSAGRILIDGHDIASMPQAMLRAGIAVVPQEVVLFHRSVLENIRYARPGASDEAVRQAARAAECHGFIRALPRGYATLVGERGTRLSGGQRQRIGIARAILSDAPIIVLDEATSALDSEAEAKVQRALDELMRGRTVLAVAHRLSTVADFDRVIVIDGGRIVEDGPPAELRRRGGLFGRMWRLQTDPASRAPSSLRGYRARAQDDAGFASAASAAGRA
jgi:ATP-binding cassette subfamily B protein